jgi:tetratricopeptide (TPR) repeat protein
MSHINDALKKAQEEKDSIYKKYGRIISAPSYSKKGGKGKLLAASICVSLVLLFSLFLLARYMIVPSDAGGDRVSVQAVNKKETPPHRETIPPLPPVAENPRNSQDLYEEALGHQRKGDLGGAERLYRTLLDVDPGFAFALNNLGVIYMGNKRDEDAIEMFERAIEEAVDYVDPYYNLACIYAKRGGSVRSLEYLKIAVQLNNSVKNWAKNDKDLGSVSSLEEFKEIVR